MQVDQYDEYLTATLEDGTGIEISDVMPSISIDSFNPAKSTKSKKNEKEVAEQMNYPDTEDVGAFGLTKE